MQQVLIITGGHLNIDFAKAYLKTLSYDKVFAVDKGLEYADTLDIVPDYIVGDFDTVDEGVLALYEKRIQSGKMHAKLERHPAKKDATDTELAIDRAIEEGAECITILAATGSRMDHVLANMDLLLQMHERCVKAYIVDETNRIQLLSADDGCVLEISKEEQFGKYISLLPVTPQVEGVTLRGALYPLDNATLYRGRSLSVSNQIRDEKIVIQIGKGSVFVVESKDN